MTTRCRADANYLRDASLWHPIRCPRGIKPVSPAQAEKLGLDGKQYAAVGAHKPEAPLKAHY